MSVENALFIMAVILIVFLIFCIPVFLRAWRITDEVLLILQAMNKNMPSILKNMNDITGNVNSSSGLINRKIEDYSKITDWVIQNIIAVAKGLRVFGEVLLKKDKVNIE